MQSTVSGIPNPPADPQVQQSSVPIVSHTQNVGHLAQQPLQPSVQVGAPPAQPLPPVPNAVAPATNGPAVAPAGGNGAAQNTLRPFGRAASTPGASSNPNLHTCGWLVERNGLAVGKCGASIANDKASIGSHIALYHGVDIQSEELKACGWAMGPTLGTSKRCTHSPAGENMAEKIRNLHLGPNANKRVCDYPDCMASTERARRCAAHLNATW